MAPSPNKSIVIIGTIKDSFTILVRPGIIFFTDHKKIVIKIIHSNRVFIRGLYLL